MRDGKISTLTEQLTSAQAQIRQLIASTVPQTAHDETVRLLNEANETIGKYVGTCGELARVERERDLYKEKAALLDKPEIHDFAKAVVLEAAHQRARWGNDHDEGKTDADWFWLIGWLGGKAVHNPPADDGRTAEELQLHRIITVAAAACNWHAFKLGQTNMRPGIAAPTWTMPARCAKPSKFTEGALCNNKLPCEEHSCPFDCGAPGCGGGCRT